MNASPSSTGTSNDLSGYETHRRLDEPVMPSAAEEVLVHDPVTTQGSAPAEWPFTEGPSAYRAGGTWTAGQGSEGGAAWLSRGTDALAHYVAEQPLRATLMAVGVGVLAALAWGRRGGARRRSRD